MPADPSETYKSEQGLKYPTMADDTGKYGCHASMTPVPLATPWPGCSTALFRLCSVLLLVSFVALPFLFLPGASLLKDDLEAVQQCRILCVDAARYRKV